MYLVSNLGYHLLFQDADIVWFHDPLQVFAGEEYVDFDTLFMDDGARSLRYSPFFANSGFYFLRSNGKTKNFMHRLLVSFDYIMQTRSHQHILDRFLAEHSAMFGMRTKVLRKDVFPQGQVFHHNKALMEEFVQNKKKPSVFHMCWTANKKDKLKYMKQTGIWFLTDTCDEGWLRGTGQRAGAGGLRACCDAGAVAWRPGGEMPSLKS